MNTMGKTLVIINLAFALLMLAFVATVAVTGTNWKKYSEDISNELIVSRANTEGLAVTKKQLMAELQQDYTRIEKLEKDFEDFKTKAKQDLEKEKKNVVDANTKADRERITSTQTAGETGRLQAEVTFLHKTIDERNKSLAELQAKKTQAEEDKAQAVAEATSAKVRSQEMQAQLRELQKQRAMAQVTSTTTAPTVKDPNEPNPPRAAVKGVIEKIDDRDRSLVLISIGTDAGVDKNNTLEVYRLLPRPEYLGMIRIVEANPHKAIGQLMRSSRTNAQSDLRPGDEVASQIR